MKGGGWGYDGSIMLVGKTKHYLKIAALVYSSELLLTFRPGVGNYRSAKGYSRGSINSPTKGPKVASVSIVKADQRHICLCLPVSEASALDPSTTRDGHGVQA